MRRLGWRTAVAPPARHHTRQRICLLVVHTHALVLPSGGEGAAVEAVVAGEDLVRQAAGEGGLDGRRRPDAHPRPRAHAVGAARCRPHAHGDGERCQLEAVGGALLQRQLHEGGEQLARHGVPVPHGAVRGHGQQHVARVPAAVSVRPPAEGRDREAVARERRRRRRGAHRQSVRRDSIQRVALRAKACIVHLRGEEHPREGVLRVLQLPDNCPARAQPTHPNAAVVAAGRKQDAVWAEPRSKHIRDDVAAGRVWWAKK